MSEEKTTLSEILKTKREELDLSITQLARELRISETYLRALEAGEHDKLPGEVYIRAYLSSLTKRLDLDFEEVLKVYSNEFNVATTSPKDDLIDFNTHGVAITQPKSRLPYILGAIIVIVSFAIIKLTVMGRGGEGAINLDDISSQTIDTLNDMTQNEDTLNTAPLLDTLASISTLPTKDSTFKEPAPIDSTPKVDPLPAQKPNDKPEVKSSTKDSVTQITFRATSKTESTWFSVKAKFDKDSSRYARFEHGPVKLSMKDTLNVEVGDLTKIKFRIANGSYKSPRDFKFKVFNNRLIK